LRDRQKKWEGHPEEEEKDSQSKRRGIARGREEGQPEQGEEDS